MRLFAMCRLILVRVLATRARCWAEKVKLLDENQAGFQGRSTADATQVIVKIQEDIADYRERREQRQKIEEEREEKVFEARQLDLEKTYPRVYRPGIWKILK